MKLYNPYQDHHGYAVKYVSGVFTVPYTGAYLIKGVGGGGGGAAGGDSDGTTEGSGGEGGVSGEEYTVVANLTKGDTIDFTVGTGGVGGNGQVGADGLPGADGNATTFGTYLTADGGHGAQNVGRYANGNSTNTNGHDGKGKGSGYGGIQHVTAATKGTDNTGGGGGGGAGSLTSPTGGSQAGAQGGSGILVLSW